MKTLKIFAALSLTLIFIGVTTVYSKSNSNTAKGQESGVIKYQVNVHSINHLLLPPMQVFVEITDENGNPVARPQVFTPGIWVYTFAESGPVIGARIARMVLSLNGTFEEYPYPDIKKCKFLNGDSYLFNLYPAEQRLGNGNVE